jgi:hypothetical protein
MATTSQHLTQQALEQRWPCAGRHVGRCSYAVSALLCFMQVRGYGLSGDGHHITAPHPAGIGASLAMRRALQGSGIPASSICYVNAHATSTPVGDEIEQAAILDVFGPEQVGEMCANVVVLAGASSSCICLSFVWRLEQAFVLVLAVCEVLDVRWDARDLN